MGLVVVLFPVPPPASAATLADALTARLSHGVGIDADREGEDLLILGRFYEARAMAPLWVTEAGPTGQARQLLAALTDAAAEGLDPRDYAVSRIAALMDRGDSVEALAELEFLLTDGLLGFGRDVSAGRLEPAKVDPELFLERTSIDPAALLAGAAMAEDLPVFLAALPPTRPEYRRLRDALKTYRLLEAAGGWPALPDGPTLKPGQSDARVPILRRRLAVTGELAGDPPASPDPRFYDSALEAAVRLFQRRHGLEPDGAVGRATRLALNVPAAERVRQIVINMERWRWLPRDLGERYLMVNLAAFELAVFDGTEVVHGTRVIVGEPFRRTPVFSGRMTFLEVNPYWNVPPRIAREEILPKARRNPGYLAENGYTLLSDWTEKAVVVDPRAVDWSVPSASLRYRVRQEPGDRNALGRIKFMFPNQFDVYLHDTPSKRLFAKASRTFSHGCIRVENPFELAETVLRLTGTTGWDRAALDAAAATGRRQIVRLATALPVHITYVTAFVDADGTVEFRDDVYGRDRRLTTALASMWTAATSTPVEEILSSD